MVKVKIAVISACLLASIAELLHIYFIPLLRNVTFNFSGLSLAGALAAVIGWVTAHVFRRLDEVLNLDGIPGEKLDDLFSRLNTIRQAMWGFVCLYVLTLLSALVEACLKDSIPASASDWVLSIFGAGFVCSLISLLPISFFHGQANEFSGTIRKMKAEERAAEQKRSRKARLAAHNISAPPIEHIEPTPNGSH